MMRWMTCVALMTMTVAAPAMAQKKATEPLHYEGARSEVYKTVNGSELHVFIFEPAGHKPADKTPAIVFFFGGGWVGGSPKQFENHARYLASRGMVAITVEYRTRTSHNTTPFECVADGKSALRWARKNAARLGIDPDHLAASGGSAGGHVAAAVATVPRLDEPGEDTAVSCVPNALVLFNPVYDNGPKGYGHERVGDRYKEISPIDNLRPGVPPSIVFLGTADKLIPVDTARRFQALCKEAGSRSELMLFDGAAHGFFNFKQQGDNTAYKQTVEAMDRFLTSLGYLSGEPTINSK